MNKEALEEFANYLLEKEMLIAKKCRKIKKTVNFIMERLLGSVR